MVNHDDTPPLQTVVQINMYREYSGRYEYLLLKRIDHDDKFWQVVTEPVPVHGTIAETLRAAARSQAGVHGFKHLSKEMYSYEWYAHGDRGRDIVFAAEVGPDVTISPDSSLYSQYAWLPYEEAVQRLKWDGNKEALRRLAGHLRIKRLNTPLPPRDPTAGFYHNGPERYAVSQTVQAQPNPGNGPYGPNVPKRLPDPPEPPLVPPDDDDSKPGALFI